MMELYVIHVERKEDGSVKNIRMGTIRKALKED
jgi:hypothetical protein